MDKLKGSMSTLSSMQLTADIEGLDAQSKTILRSTEVLAVILRETVAEYRGCSRKEVMDFIETDSITNGKEVSQGRTNTQVRSDNIEFVQLNEKTSLFDLAFRARNPILSTETMQISIHVDIESQKTYKPGYPVEKRGLYYLARRLASQLSLVTETTDYAQLEKCYSIWICRDDVPKEERYTVSVYEIANTKNIGINTLAKENYDLMTLVVIKLGNEVYNGKKEDEGYDLLRFLNAIMYPHRRTFITTISDYIDFSENEELWKEAKHMDGLGWCIYHEIREEIMDEVKNEVRESMENEVREKVKDEVRAEVKDEVRAEVKDEVRAEIKDEVRDETREDAIQAVILDYVEDELPMERILIKLQKVFGLTEEKSALYFQKFAAKA